MSWCFQKGGGGWVDKVVSVGSDWCPCVGSNPTSATLKFVSFAEWLKITYMPPWIALALVALQIRMGWGVAWTSIGATIKFSLAPLLGVAWQLPKAIDPTGAYCVRRKKNRHWADYTRTQGENLKQLKHLHWNKRHIRLGIQYLSKNMFLVCLGERFQSFL